jgi:hypothetical protein
MSRKQEPLVQLTHRDGRWWWQVITTIAVFKGSNRTKWGANRNIKRVLQWEMDDELANLKPVNKK